MATKSPNSQNPATSTPGIPLVVEHDATYTEVAKNKATNDATEIPFPPHLELMREEQVQNAVKFLSHPKVSDTPIIYRRSFLERKGLTKEEIDEAFRLVPDPPPSNVSSVEVPVTNQALIQSTSFQPQPPVQSLQLAGAPASNVSMVPGVQDSRFRLSQVLITVGLLCASAYGSTLIFKNFCVPRLKSWVRKVIAEEIVPEKDDELHSALLEQTTEAAKAAAMASTVVAKASEQLLNSKTEEREYFKAFMNKIDEQVKEMKSVGEAIQKLEGTKENGEYQDKLMEEYIGANYGTTNISPENYQQSLINGTANPDYTSVRPSSSPATVEPTTAPHPKSYMEIIAMIQRGERPSNIREINDMPPNPNQQPSKPALAPRPKPWELSQPNNEDQSEPRWKKKVVNNTEIVSDSNNISALPPSKKAWVPPQPPPVSVPEAAAAIRHPKKYPSSDIADSNNGDGTDTETNGGKLKGGETSIVPIIEDVSEKEDEGTVELDKSVRSEQESSISSFVEQNGDEIVQVNDDAVEIS